MRALISVATLACVVVAAKAAPAQVHVHPDPQIGARAQAPLSSQAQMPLTIGQPSPGDLFRAGADTYTPRYDDPRPLPHYRNFPPLGYGYPGVYVPPTSPPVTVVNVHPARETIIYRPAPAPPAASPRAPALPPPAPKTFYVIPGCYAGDRPPEASRLPAGCDVARVRRVDPR